MKIQTIFDIDDEVFIMKQNKIKKVTITGIITELEKGKEQKIKYFHSADNIYQSLSAEKEENVFASKEGLLKFLEK